MSNNAIQSKWDRIYSEEGGEHWPPAEVLSQNQHLLPKGGTALDLACGFGPNALLLAQRGFTTHAWDISPVAIAALKKTAQARHLEVHAVAKDIDGSDLLAARFDVIVVAHYLDRKLMPYLRDAIKPGGLLFYQTFITEKVDAAGPSNIDFLLQPNELLHAVPGFRILVYREEGLQGNTAQGFRNKAMLVGWKSSG